MRLVVFNVFFILWIPHHAFFDSFHSLTVHQTKKQTKNPEFIFCVFLAHLQAFPHVGVGELPVLLSYCIRQPPSVSWEITYSSRASSPSSVHLWHDWGSVYTRAPEYAKGLPPISKYTLHFAFIKGFLYSSSRRGKMHSPGFSSSVCPMPRHDHRSCADSLWTDAEHILK